MTSTPKRKRIEARDTHSRRLIKLAEEQLVKGNRYQASENAWRAVAHQVKVIAAKRGWKYVSHDDFHKIASKIAKETDNPVQMNAFFGAAQYLHRNYYVDSMPLRSLKEQIDVVKELLKVLNGPTFLDPKKRTPRKRQGASRGPLGTGDAKELGGQGRPMGKAPKSRKRQASAFGGKKTTQRMPDIGEWWCVPTGTHLSR